MAQVVKDQIAVIKHELYEKNKFIYNFIEGSSDFISIIDKFGNRKFINQSAQDILGYDLNKLIGNSVFSLVHEEDRKELAELLLQLPVLKSVDNFQNRLILQNGSVMFMCWSFSWDEETEYIYTIGKDITAKRQVKEKLQNIAWKHSHEIRGPLTSIMGIVSAMKCKISLEEKMMLLDSLEQVTNKLDQAIHSIIDETQLSSFNEL